MKSRINKYSRCFGDFRRAVLAVLTLGAVPITSDAAASSLDYRPQIRVLSSHDLHPPNSPGVSEIWASSVSNQVGHVNGRAALWSGSASSYVDIHPGGAISGWRPRSSFALSVHDGRAVGYVNFHRDVLDPFIEPDAGNAPVSWTVENGTATAMLGAIKTLDDLDRIAYSGIWGNQIVGVSSGKAALWNSGNLILLDGEQANGTSGSQQVGSYAGRAVIWFGSSASRVDLHPRGFNASVARATSGEQQVGYVSDGTRNRAALWSGSADSFTELHPAFSEHSEAYAVDGSFQAGFATIKAERHAAVWAGTSESFFDLATGPLTGSDARGVAVVDRMIYVAGTSGGHASLWKLSAGSLTFHSISETGYVQPITSATELIPKTDRDALDQQSAVFRGLVADGVTPLLCRFTLPNGPKEANFRIQAFVTGRSFPPLEIRTLRDMRWEVSNLLHIPANMTNGYFYFKPLNPENFSAQELAYKVQLIEATSGQVYLEETLSVRKPPVVLIHGFNSDKSTWSPEFLRTIGQLRGADFVTNINYGVIEGEDEDPLNYPNTKGRLADLTIMLDRVLALQIEAPNTSLHTNWAFTKYDIVAHSQGGVLTRLLCSTRTTPWGTLGFSNPGNFHRGRFSRVITIGSPFNGSTEVYYARKLQEAYRRADPQNANLTIPEIVLLFLEDYLQPKFDPFEGEIRFVSQIEVDAAAKFHAIRTRIAPCFWLAKRLHLCEVYGGKLRYESVYPLGTDGVVDLESQSAGVEFSSTTTVLDINISHSESRITKPGVFNFDVFDTGPAKQTAHERVAAKVVELLEAPLGRFGPLSKITQLSADRRETIDKSIPDIIAKPGLVGPDFPEPNRMLFSRAASQKCFDYVLTPANSHPVQGAPLWFVESFCPDGVSQNGITWNVSPSDPKKVSVCIDDGVKGEVVLYVNYPSENGSVVTTPPLVILSRPVGEQLMKLELVLPATMDRGTTAIPKVWGHYFNGTRSRIFNGKVELISSEETTLQVSSAGWAFANSPGASTVTAKYSGLEATSLVTVTDPASENFDTDGPRLAAVQIVPGGIRIAVQGLSAKRYSIQKSTDLRVWVDVIASIADSAGRVEHSEPAGLTSAYYRAVEVP